MTDWPGRRWKRPPDIPTRGTETFFVTRQTWALILAGGTPTDQHAHIHINCGYLQRSAGGPTVGVDGLGFARVDRETARGSVLQGAEIT